RGIRHSVSALQIVDQVAQGDARPNEDGCSTENLPVAMHGRGSLIGRWFHLFRSLAQELNRSYRSRRLLPRVLSDSSCTTWTDSVGQVVGPRTFLWGRPTLGDLLVARGLQELRLTYTL